MSKVLSSCLAAALTFAAHGVQAHPGHGLFGPHWHAADTLGLLLAGVVASAAWWLLRGK